MKALSAEEDKELATTPTEKLLDLDWLKPIDLLHAYQFAKDATS